MNMNLLKSISYVSDKNVADTEKYIKKKYFRLNGLLVASLAICICIAVISSTPNKQEPSPSSSLWQLNSLSKDNVIKTMKTKRQVSMMINVNFANLNTETISNVNFEPETDICLELFGQWYITQVSFDYANHFSLFQPEFVYNQFTVDALKKGFTYEEAIEQINEISIRPFGYYEYEFCYSIVNIQNKDNEDLITFRNYYSEVFTRVGLDPKKIEAVSSYDIENAKLILNENYYSDCDDNIFHPFEFYKYEGKWYILPNCMENDFSIDLIGKPTEYWHKESKMNGVIIEKGKHYIILDKGNHFSVENTSNLEVGDNVQVIYYSEGSLTVHTFNSDGWITVKAAETVHVLD